MIVKLLTELLLEFLSLNGGCTGSFEYTLVKMPHCWKSHVAAQIIFLSLKIVFVFAINTSTNSAIHESHKSSRT